MKASKYQEIGNIGSIIISEKMKRKIDYLHENIGATEWSGILVYKTLVKSIKSLKNLLFRAEDIFLMDIGSAAYTTYKYDGGVVDMYDNIPEAMNMNIGIAHSHHNMKAFFSGTDIDEIAGNAEHYNYYISLVVSFDGKYVCKIAIPVKENIECKYKFRDTNGKEQCVKVKEERINVIVGDLSVRMEKSYSPDQWFIDRLTDIKRKAVVVAKSKTPAKVTTPDFTYDKKTSLFIANIVSPIDVTEKDYDDGKMSTYKLMKELGELDESDIEYICSHIEQNVSIIHYNIYGKNEVFNEPVHIRKAINDMKVYKYISPEVSQRIEKLCKILENNLIPQMDYYGKF